jgi:low affinity Fe/Cu permease
MIKRQAADSEGLSSSFRKASGKTAQVVGSPFAFLSAVGGVVLWSLLGRHFHYSDTWQLVINTGTTIITFLVVFLIQNTQNRDARAIHLKLDEIIRATRGADNRMIDAENLSDTELLALVKSYERLRSEYERRTTRAKTTRKKA